MSDIEQGDHVTWTYGTGTINRGRSSGEVLETGVSKGPHDDVLKVRPDSGTPDCYIRPNDVVGRNA